MESSQGRDVRLADDSQVAEGFLTFHRRRRWFGKEQRYVVEKIVFQECCCISKTVASDTELLLSLLRTSP